MSDQLTMFGEPAPARKPVKASLSKTISCGAEKLFDRWLIPTFVGNWMFGEQLGDDGVGDMSNEVRPARKVVNMLIISQNKLFKS